MSRRRRPTPTFTEPERSTVVYPEKQRAAECTHASFEMLVIPRTKDKQGLVWRLDWCGRCGSVRVWSGPADSNASPWRLPELLR